MFVEHKINGTSFWRSHGGQFSPGRNYIMFGHLANVRSEGAIHEPKGLPEDLSFQTHDHAYLIITKDECDSCVTLAKAQEWHEKYGAEIVYHDKLPTHVRNPDWHTPTWMTSEEYSAVLDKYFQTTGYRAAEYEAVLAAMQTLEKYDREVRVVFWFDN